jgi:hypothetical protein
MLERLLRYPLPDQIKALCEKIEANPDDASSIGKVELLIPSLRFYERFMVRRALDKSQRSRILNYVMEIVIGSKNDNDRF